MFLANHTSTTADSNLVLKLVIMNLLEETGQTKSQFQGSFICFYLFALNISGYRKNDDLCTPLAFKADGSNNCSLTFLEYAVAIFKQWKESGQSGLTKETFTACIQSMEAMMALTSYLITKHDFQYILPGKFTSDPIEGRFGWYRQVNGGNFYMSILQLFQAEKKIRCLSLLRQNALHTLAGINTRSEAVLTEYATDESWEDTSWLKDWAMQTNITEVSDEDASVTYYVAGYIGRCISRRRKCTACTNLAQT